MKDYLRRQSLAGTLDSSGCFTVDLAAAGRKLGRSLFADPTLYLLKLVQAGVLAGCSGLDIRLTRQRTEIVYRDWRGPLPQTLETGHPLTLGVAALLELHPRRTTLEGGQDTGVRLCVDFDRRPREAVRAELHTLSTRCLFAPVPVVVNEQSVCLADYPDYAHRPLWNAYLPHQTVLGEARAGKWPEVETGSDHPRLELSGCSRWMLLRIGLAQKAELHLVRHGVIIETRRPYLGVAGLQAALDVSHLDADVGGFQLVEDEAYHRTLDELEQGAEALRRAVLENLDRLQATRGPFSLSGRLAWRNPAVGGSVGAVSAGICWMASLGDIITGGFLLGSPLLVCASLATASLLGGRVMAPGERCHQALREEIKSRLSEK